VAPQLNVTIDLDGRSFGYDRRCIMAIAVQQIHPVAHVPLALGVLRRLEVATISKDPRSKLRGFQEPSNKLSCTFWGLFWYRIYRRMISAVTASPTERTK
jgi:hypothetical protein